MKGCVMDRLTDEQCQIEFEELDRLRGIRTTNFEGLQHAAGMFLARCTPKYVTIAEALLYDISRRRMYMESRCGQEPKTS